MTNTSNQENLDAFKGYSMSCFNEKGYYGIDNFHWVMQCVAGCMFMFGSLKFCPSYFTDDFPVLKRNNEYVTLIKGGFGIDKYHKLTRNENEIIAKTYFYEDENKIIANRISKDGNVSFEAEEFDKKEYENFLRGDYHTIDIHIPSNIKYTKEVMFDSYKKALDFYSKYYPEHKIKAIVSYSWLYSPELIEIFDENSNIIKVQKNNILYSSVRPILKHYGIIKSPKENMIASTGFIILSSKKNPKYNDFFYNYIISESNLNKLVSIAASNVSAYPSINPDDLLDLYIPVPTGYELLDDFIANIEPSYETISLNQKENEELTKLRDYLLPLLMNGQIEVK